MKLPGRRGMTLANAVSSLRSEIDQVVEDSIRGRISTNVFNEAKLGGKKSSVKSPRESCSTLMITSSASKDVNLQEPR